MKTRPFPTQTSRTHSKKGENVMSTYSTHHAQDRRPRITRAAAFGPVMAVIALAILAAVASANSAAALPAPEPPFFSIDRQSPSLGTGSGADVLGVTAPGQFDIEVPASGLGLADAIDIDAISGGDDFVDPVDPCPVYVGPTGIVSTIYFWSVDRNAIGSANGGQVMALAGLCYSFGAPVLAEQSDGAAGDIFVQLWDTKALNPLVRFNLKFQDEEEIGLKGLPGSIDELDALQHVLGGTGTPDFDTNGDGISDVDVFYSLDPAPAAALGISPADVLVTYAGVPGTSVFFAAAALGLQAADDIDALCYDRDTSGLLISLTPGSPSLAGQDAVFGTPDDFSPGDAFRVSPIDPFPGSGIQVPFLPHDFLSLRFEDDLDALSCHLGDPGEDTPGHDLSELVWGDWNCDGSVTSVDALILLLFVVGRAKLAAVPCPAINDAVPAAEGLVLWGDSDCNDKVDAVDALRGLKFVAGSPVPAVPGCPVMGAIVPIPTPAPKPGPEDYVWCGGPNPTIKHGEKHTFTLAKVKPETLDPESWTITKVTSFEDPVLQEVTVSPVTGKRNLWKDGPGVEINSTKVHPREVQPQVNYVIYMDVTWQNGFVENEICVVRVVHDDAGHGTSTPTPTPSPTVPPHTSTPTPSPTPSPTPTPTPRPTPGEDLITDCIPADFEEGSTDSSDDEPLPREPAPEEEPTPTRTPTPTPTPAATWLDKLLDDVFAQKVYNNTYVKDAFDCDDFAHILELRLSGLGYHATFTAYWCEPPNDAKDYPRSKGHAVTDVHANDGSIVWIEPQARDKGKMVLNLDFDGDGTVEFDDDHSWPRWNTDGNCRIEVYESQEAAVGAGVKLD